MLKIIRCEGNGECSCKKCDDKGIRNRYGIHKRANCRYSDMRTALDILYQLIKDGMLESSFYNGDKNVSNM